MHLWINPKEKLWSSKKECDRVEIVGIEPKSKIFVSSFYLCCLGNIIFFNMFVSFIFFTMYISFYKGFLFT